MSRKALRRYAPLLVGLALAACGTAGALPGARPQPGPTLQARPTSTPTPAVALPLVLRHGLFADTCEPNNTPSQATCVLRPGISLWSFIWDASDPDDYFYFDPPAGQARVDLQGIPPGCDYDLLVYTCVTYPCQQVAESRNWGNMDESVTFSTTGNLVYYVRVYPFQGSNNLHPYRLTAFYPYP